tara:strand:+ start:502 stop:756 length:255 start_codon:yes stop_codon:yes gene_type:complete
MSHLLDRFQCLFKGLLDRTVDYDACKCDKSIETNMAVARLVPVTLNRMLLDLRRHEEQGVVLLVRESVHHTSPKSSSAAICSGN